MANRKSYKPRKNTLATFSRANFDAAVAEPDTKEEVEEFTEEDETVGESIIEELVLSGDIDALDDILERTEEGLVEQVEAGMLSQAEAEELLEDEVAYLEELLALVAEEGIPEEELLGDEDEYDEDDDEDDYEAEASAEEEEGADVLEQLEPEEIIEVFNYALADLEDDCDAVDQAVESGEIDEEEAEELYDIAAVAYEDLADEFQAYLDALGVELDEDYNDEGYDDDPLVEHVEALTQEVAYQRRQNARMEAEFSSGQMAQDISDRLDYLERVGDELVQQGIMPPAVFEREFGNWANERDRFAGFSYVCQANGTDPATELAHKERTIEMFAEFAEAGAPLYAPGLMSYDEEFDEDELEELDNIAAQATRNVRHLLGIV
jgi:hypothetical protein